MKRHITKSILLAFCSILLYSCTKKEIPAPKAEVALLVNKKWQITSKSTKDRSGFFRSDEYQLLPAYEKDNYYLFRSDSTYEYNDNVNTRPELSSKILDAGTWKLINGNTNLELHSTIFATTYNPSKIIELSENKLSLQTDYPGDHSTVWMTYKAF